MSLWWVVVALWLGLAWGERIACDVGEWDGGVLRFAVRDLLNGQEALRLLAVNVSTDELRRSVACECAVAPFPSSQSHPSVVDSVWSCLPHLEILQLSDPRQWSAPQREEFEARASGRCAEWARPLQPAGFWARRFGGWTYDSLYHPNPATTPFATLLRGPFDALPNLGETILWAESCPGERLKDRAWINAIRAQENRLTEQLTEQLRLRHKREVERVAQQEHQNGLREGEALCRRSLEKEIEKKYRRLIRIEYNRGLRHGRRAAQQHAEPIEPSDDHLAEPDDNHPTLDHNHPLGPPVPCEAAVEVVWSSRWAQLWGELEEVVRCPITLERMVDPVVNAKTGQTYDGPVIRQWLQNHGSDPNTGLPSSPHDLASNFLAKHLLDVIRRHQLPTQ